MANPHGAFNIEIPAILDVFRSLVRALVMAAGGYLEGHTSDDQRFKGNPLMMAAWKFRQHVVVVTKPSVPAAALAAELAKMSSRRAYCFGRTVIHDRHPKEEVRMVLS